MKLHRKINHNVKMCRAEVMVPIPKIKATIWSEVKFISQPQLETTEANVMKLHRKIKHNEKVCCGQHLGSCAQGQCHNLVRGQIRVSAITKKSLKQI